METDEAACRKKDPKPWQPSNDPYTGPGPHYINPIRVQLDPGGPKNSKDPGGPSGVNSSMDLSTMSKDMQIPTARIPTGWQLIACVYTGQPTRRSGTITCYFNNLHKSKKYPLYESRYEVIVREARTAKKVTTLSVPGTTTPRGDCPSFVQDTGPTTKILKPLNGQTLTDKLRPTFTTPK